MSAITTVRVRSLETRQEIAGETRCELDNHADTCVVGPGTCLEIHDFERPVRVHGYDSSVSERKSCRTVSAVVAYDDPLANETFMLTIHQAVMIPRMESTLLCPNQMRCNDVRVNDEPKSMVLNPTNDHHALIML